MGRFLPSFIFFVLVIAGSAGAETRNPAFLFEKANASYRGGDYIEAVSRYEDLVRQGKGNAEVYYNLGNSHFKQKQIGPAILNYERAKRLSPRDRDIRANLDYVKGLVEYRIEDKRNWYLRALDIVLESFTAREAGIASLALGVLFWLSWAYSLYFRSHSVWGWRRKTLLVLTLCLFGLWILKGTREAIIQEAIVFKDQATVRYGPSYKDKVAFKLGEGMKVRLKQKTGDWSRVVLMNGETGWMIREELGVI